MKKWLLIALLIITSIISCRGLKSVDAKSENNTDSSEKVVYIDKVKVDTIRIPGETIKVKVPIEKIKHDTVIVYRKGKVSTHIIYQDGKMEVTANCDSLEKLVLSYEKVRINNKNTNTEKTLSEKEKIVKGFPWYVKLAFGISGLSILYVSFKLSKFLV